MERKPDRVTPRTQTWLDHTGLNLIRIVVGSYFIAITMGLITGFEPTALFVLYSSPVMADLIGTIVLFSLTIIYMTGWQLRLSCLALALFVLTSSLAQNFMISPAGTISDFWRDLTLVCAVILSYSSLGRAELRKAALVGRHRIVGPRRLGDRIVPRRVTLETSARATSRPMQDIPMLAAAPSDMPRFDEETSGEPAQEQYDFKAVRFETTRKQPEPSELPDTEVELNLLSDDDPTEDSEQKNIFAPM
ncbi:hypothetical protein RZ517_10615 [Roseovarius sp. S88]|uniref:Membrane protein YphA (DoxX/SURF4 family) n=1 Tax=Roseovarius phycicola TaxID=3080976 RepID=A0ABZ2HFS9_9RHOB